MSVLIDAGLAGLADVSDVMGPLSHEYAVGQVGQFSFDAVDVDGALSRRGVLRAGTTLRIGGGRWDVAAVARDYRGRSTWLTVECRSAVARRMRLLTGLDKATDTTPGAYIAKYVRACGGTAVVEPGAKRRTIAPKRNESLLDVISSLSGDMSTEWVEIDGKVFVGTGWWALQGKPGLPTYPVAINAETVESSLGAAPLLGSNLSTRESLDDVKAAAAATLMLEKPLGQFVRPWHRVDLIDVAAPDKGVWLVKGVTYDESGADVSVSLERPLRSSPKSGSSGQSQGNSGAGGDYVAPEDGWVPGSTKVWRMCNKTPRKIVELALAEAANGTNWGSGNCLNWVSHVCTGSPPYFGASGGHGGMYARYVWDNMPAGTPHGSDRDAPAGSLVVWRHNSVGHIAIAVGGGRMVTTSSGPVRLMGIGDYMGWGGYAGWMAPNFWM